MWRKNDLLIKYDKKTTVGHLKESVSSFDRAKG